MKKFLIIIALLSAISFLWYRTSLRAVSIGDSTRVSITIEKGMSVNAIATLLEEKGLIRSPLAFSFYAKRSGKEGSLQAGKFVLRPSMSTPEVITALLSGKSEEMIITIPEGFTVRDIDLLLADRGLTEAGDIIDCAKNCDFSSFEFLPNKTGLAPRGGQIEGYLFPDTYYVNAEEFVPKFFLERLMTTFRERVVEGLAQDITDSGRSLHEIVTMASLIEEETRTDEERPVVSGIMWKRYDAGQGLGIDATVRYILNKQTGPLTVADLNNNSPYNTRKFRGIPPGPIASVGLKSINAALHPEESEYWYYLHGTDGEIHYAVSNEEHNMNKYYYLK